MRKSLFLCCLLSLLPCFLQAGIHITPYPNELITTMDPGIELTSDMTIGVDERFEGDIQRLVTIMRRSMGYPIPVAPGAPGTITIRYVPDLGEEAYTLTSNIKGITITASTGTGAYYGMMTLLQMLPPDIFAYRPVLGITWHVPAVKISDKPRFRWRGILIDEARNFYGPATIKAQLDVMSMYKLNVLHWHLTDDQGWRMQINKYPQLTYNGAKRDSSPRIWNRTISDDTPYGHYTYTQWQMREIVAYAAERKITVIPEIDMPGHCAPIAVCFPDLSCTGKNIRMPTTWDDCPTILCASNPHVIDLIKDLYDEILDIFPSEYIHIGGVAVPSDQWSKCQDCMTLMDRLGFTGTEQLHAYMMNKIGKYVESKGRKVIAWDADNERDTPRSLAYMCYSSTESGVKAARAGHPVVLAPNDYLYLDAAQGYAEDPYEYRGDTVNTLEHVYSFNPLLGIGDKFAKNVLGVQGCLWTEYVHSRTEVEWKLWPRAMAIAEIGWTDQQTRSWRRFQLNMSPNHQRLGALAYTVAPRSPTVMGTWKAGQIPTTSTVVTYDASDLITIAGDYQITFAYSMGFSRLIIDRVELVVNDIIVSADEHQGSTGFDNVARVYRVGLTRIPPDADIKIRATVRCDVSSDSNGAVLIMKD